MSYRGKMEQGLIITALPPRFWSLTLSFCPHSHPRPLTPVEAF